LAELGVMAYELDGHQNGFQILESEGWPENRPVPSDAGDGADGSIWATSAPIDAPQDSRLASVDIDDERGFT
ncbi:hypothetical protein, partial [Paraburkholderia sp. BR14427]|uniref:hypothetical protein n=1 Tax=Paraburkholderia sp. BR14427 TaxID=3237008 RepID=UPI0034CFC20E